MAFPTLTLSSKLEHALSSGHPWIYRDHLPENDLETGEWVLVQSGRARAFGLYDANSPIALRLFGTEEPDSRLIAERVNTALELRKMVFDASTTAFRLLAGEGDFLPGITVDKYGRYAVVQTYADCLEVVLPDVIAVLAKSDLRLKGIVRRASSSSVLRTSGELETLWGEAPPPELTILENDLKIIANLYDGQKTGLFLDHRDNRALLGRLAKDFQPTSDFEYEDDA